MTFSDLQDHTPNADHLKCDYSYSYAAADKTSIDTARRAVSLQELSVLFEYCSVTSVVILTVNFSQYP